MNENQATPLNAVGNSAGSGRADYMPQEGVSGFSLKQEPTALVDSALQVYARTGMYPDSRALHEAAMAYRAELIRIMTEHGRDRAVIEKALAALLEAKVGIADQWKRDGVVGTPLRNASIAVDAGIEALRVAGVAVESNRGTTNG